MSARAAALRLLWLLCALACASPAGADDPDPANAGLRMYRDGVLPSGAPLTATGQNGITLRGSDAACANCHLRSGYGTSEGRTVTRALPPLFDRGWLERSALRARPVGSGRPPLFYTATSLARALRVGLGAAGQPLDALMPRYEIDDASSALIAKHLETLATKTAPGVTASSLRFATVVTPDADRARAAAMVDVLRAFLADKNGATRSETRRRTSGSEWMYQGHRTWELDVWRLQGPQESWPAQLESLYRERPVFALLSGIGARHWEPVHAFCERVEMPCVLPNASAPGASGDFYSIYFARGAAFDGTLLARHLRDRATGASGVVQVYRAGDAGSEAAQALRDALPRDAVLDVALDPGMSVAAALDAAVSGRASGLTLVLWLGEKDLAAVLAAAPPLRGASEIYVSASLASPEHLDPAPALRSRVRIVHPFDLPQARAPRVARARAWFEARHIPIEDEGVQANTFFAATLVADALGHIVDIHSREYLVERIEHMASRMPNTSVYPRISLAPGQRYASKGGYIARFSPQDAGVLVAVGDWIVP